MNDKRTAMVQRVYDKIKVYGKVTLDDVARNYDPTQVPSVVFKTESAESHYKKYISLWDAKNAGDVITFE